MTRFCEVFTILALKNFNMYYIIVNAAHVYKLMLKHGEAFNGLIIAVLAESLT